MGSEAAPGLGSAACDQSQPGAGDGESVGKLASEVLEVDFTGGSGALTPHPALEEYPMKMLVCMRAAAAFYTPLKRQMVIKFTDPRECLTLAQV